MAECSTYSKMTKYEIVLLLHHENHPPWLYEELYQHLCYSSKKYEIKSCCRGGEHAIAITSVASSRMPSHSNGHLSLSSCKKLQKKVMKGRRRRKKVNRSRWNINKGLMSKQRSKKIAFSVQKGNQPIGPDRSSSQWQDICGTKFPC